MTDDTVIIKGIGRCVTMEPAADREGPLGVIPDAAILVRDGKIAWIGPETTLQKWGQSPEIGTVPISGTVRKLNADGGVVLPGFVDCHTHLVHAGSREDEWVMRLKGASYEAIARCGGGIASTVRATRAASVEDLYATALRRADEAFAHGITTMEIKTGYGLDVATECKMLEVIRRLTEGHPITVVGTFLGAHAIPPEYATRREAYVELVIREMIPKVAETGLVRFIDVFVESVAFSIPEAERICAAGKQYGLQPRLHVDQLADGGGAAFAARMGAVSADHLEQVSAEGIAALRQSGTTAVLLPGAAFFLGGNRYPPARALLEANVPVALATDYNPGTSPVLDPFLIGTIAATQMQMTPEEIVCGLTRVPAAVLGLEQNCGSLAPGKWADLLVLDCAREEYPFYRFGHSVVRHVIKRGTPYAIATTRSG